MLHAREHKIGEKLFGYATVDIYAFIPMYVGTMIFPLHSAFLY